MDFYCPVQDAFLSTSQLVTNLSIVMDKLSMVLDKFVHKFTHYLIIHSFWTFKNVTSGSTMLSRNVLQICPLGYFVTNTGTNLSTIINKIVDMSMGDKEFVTKIRDKKMSPDF